MAFFVIRRNPLADFQDHNYNKNRYPQKRSENFSSALSAKKNETADVFQWEENIYGR
jgi:hypothetical protein